MTFMRTALVISDLKKADLEIGNSYDDCIGDSVAYVGSARDGLLLIKGINLQQAVWKP